MVKILLTKYVKSGLPTPDSSRTITALARTCLELKNILMNLGLQNTWVNSYLSNYSLKKYLYVYFNLDRISLRQFLAEIT